MNFSINGLCTENRPLSERTPIPYKIKVTDLALTIELTQTILMPRFSNFLRNSPIHVFIYGNMLPESHGFVTMPVRSCINDTCSNVSLSD